MELIPSEPPGNAKRKLRGLVEEIARLREQGYSIRVIQETLNKAGIQVSRATVHRELHRTATSALDRSAAFARNNSGRDSLNGFVDDKPGPSPLPTPPSQVVHDGSREAVPNEGKAMSNVEEFFSLHNSNPLFRK